jgi:hypothetical protein
MATKASEGCPVGCFFCIVPAMEGKAFTLLPEFTPRPVLTDNNLSALPADYQRHIVDRYLAAGVPLWTRTAGSSPRPSTMKFMSGGRRSTEVPGASARTRPESATMSSG